MSDGWIEWRVREPISEDYPIWACYGIGKRPVFVESFDYVIYPRSGDKSVVWQSVSRPEAPKTEFHKCFGPKYECYEDSSGDLIFKTFYTELDEFHYTTVNHCPYCGFQSNNKEKL